MDEDFDLRQQPGGNNPEGNNQFQGNDRGFDNEDGGGLMVMERDEQRNQRQQQRRGPERVTVKRHEETIIKRGVEGQPAEMGSGVGTAIGAAGAAVGGAALMGLGMAGAVWIVFRLFGNPIEKHDEAREKRIVKLQQKLNRERREQAAEAQGQGPRRQDDDRADTR